MAIDFYKKGCETITNEKEFGVYDDSPAKLSFTDSTNWIATVNNLNQKEIKHIAVDKCLDIPDDVGQRCDSLLIYDNGIIFIELKNRKKGRWIGEAQDQLKNTIKLYKQSYNIPTNIKCYAVIANKPKPIFWAMNAAVYQEFMNETGFILEVKTQITI